MRNMLWVLLLAAPFCFAVHDPRVYTQVEIDRLSEFSQALHSQSENIFDSETNIEVGSFCITQSDCEPTWRCENLLFALYDLVNSTSHSSEIPRLQRKAKIHGKECVRPTSEVLSQYSAQEISDRLQELVDEINEILGSSNHGVAKFGLDVNALITKRIDFSSISAPMQRVGSMAPYDPSSIMFLLFALRGKSGQTGIDDVLPLLLSLSSVQTPGTSVDNTLFNNPFLLFSLLGNNQSGSNKDLLLYSLLFSPNGGIGGDTLDPANTFSNPLILLSLLDNNNNKMNIKDLLPLLISSGGSLDGSAPQGINSILPLLFLSNSSLGSDILPLLLLSGGGQGGLGGMSSLLPLLLSTSKNSGSSSSSLKDILPLLLMGGGSNPAALGSLLPYLLLNNSSVGNDNNFLLLMALSGGMGGPSGGGLQSILPLLLMNNSSLGEDKDLLSLLLLLGGGMMGNPSFPSQGMPSNGNPGLNYNPMSMSSILPLLLLLDSGSNNIVLILYIFGFLSAVPDPFLG